MAKPLHEIMAESSAGLARQNARRKQDVADRRSYGLGNLEARMNRRPGRFTRVLDDLSGAISSGIGNVGGKIGRKAKDFGNTLSDFYGSVTKPGFFGGLQAAEINPKRVLASKWAQTPIDWEDIEPGWNLGPETDAWEALQNENLGINTWGDMYYALNNPNVNNWALSQSPMSSSILEKGLGSYMDEGYFPQIQKSWSLGNVKPTVENWRNRAWFDLDEGSFQNEGDYDRLIKENWLEDPNNPFAFQDLYQNRPRVPKDITGSGYFN